MKRLLSLAAFTVVGTLFAAPAAKDKGFYPVYIQNQGNKEVASNFAGGDATNVLKDFPTGEKKFGDVTFVVGKKLIMLGSTAQKGEPAKAEGKVNINEATRAQLMKLSGIGPGTADRIISYRQAHGPFRKAQDLEKVEGVGKGVLEKNEGRIAVK